MHCSRDKQRHGCGRLSDYERFLPQITIHLREKKRKRRVVKGSRVFCISGVCDHKVSLIRHPWCTLKRAPFDPNSTTVLPHTAQEYRSEKLQRSTDALLFSQTNVWHLPSHWTLHLVLLSKTTFDFHKKFLFEGTWKNDVRRTASKNRLLIYIQSFRYRSLYLNINIYFSWAVCLKRDVALSRVIMGNCKNIWMSVWHV